MHKSRLGTIVIDCESSDVDVATQCRSAALGWKALPLSNAADAHYRQLQTLPQEGTVLAQAVDHPSHSRAARNSFVHGSWQ